MYVVDSFTLWKYYIVQRIEAYFYKNIFQKCFGFYLYVVVCLMCFETIKNIHAHIQTLNIYSIFPINGNKFIYQTYKNCPLQR